MREIQFSKAAISTSPAGQVMLCIALPFESRQLAREFIDSMQEGHRYTAILKETKAHRTLDQNAYYWTLCGQLAATLKVPPNEIYREHIKDIGGNYYITPIKAEAVQRWMEIWQSKGIGYVAEDMGDSKINGYHNIRNYIGSSEYTTDQMSRLLDLMIADCKEQEIQTLTPDKLKLLQEEGK